MPKGYVYVEFEVTDPIEWDKYRPLAAASLAPFGGRSIVKGGDPEILEGHRNGCHIVLLEFESRRQAKAWYNSRQYQAAKAVRLSAGRVRLVLLTGQEERWT